MKKDKQKALEKAGWKVGDAYEFLEASEEEKALIEMKHRLMMLVRSVREKRSITQNALAKLLNSSQSRVAKLEGGASDVSLDLIMKALFKMGVSNKEVGKAISTEVKVSGRRGPSKKASPKARSKRRAVTWNSSKMDQSKLKSKGGSSDEGLGKGE